MGSLRISRRQFLKRALTVTGGALIVSYPLLIERFIIYTNIYQIPVPNLPQVFNGFTIVQISDLHYSFLTPPIVIERVIQAVNALEKNIVINTGDNVHKLHTTSEVDEIWPMLSQLQAPQGVYAVMGNHDHYADPIRTLEWMRRTGQNLHHSAVSIEREGQRIWLGGAGDLWEDITGVDRLFPNVPEEECKIVLAHNPDTADLPFRTRVDLMISGHTHGGQINIPFMPFIHQMIVPVENKRYVSGFVRTPRLNLFITRGIGCAGVPMRFNCPPEIAVLKLVRE